MRIVGLIETAADEPKKVNPEQVKAPVPDKKAEDPAKKPVKKTTKK